jgi:sterol desaturase/sphingolipid hydroxylase (fatty acid hydroxylase superfamily)/tricorn protease-like protein
MDWVVILRDAWLPTLAWVTALAVVFGLLTRLRPCNPGMSWWKDRRAAVTDFVYWFVVPLFLRVCRMGMLAAGVALLFSGREPRWLPVRDLPLWQQCIAIELIQDVLLYGIHRLFHTSLAWRFHAVHHSPKVLDWTSTSRFHPVNNLLAFSLADVAVLLMGFSPAALIALAPFNIVYSAMVHANLDWTFGPLRYVFASPVFHRWHHTSPEEGGNKNFASTFPLLDVLFGTFYMPPGKRPAHYGSGDPDFPEEFLGQLLYPFVGRTARSFRWAKRPVAIGALASILTVVFLFTGRRAETARPVPISVPCRTLIGHKGAVLSVALTADGRRIVSGGADGTVRIWDGATGEGSTPLAGHTGPVRGVAIRPDGERIVSASDDCTVKVWDARKALIERTCRSHVGAVGGVAICADGERIVSASAEATLTMWNAATGQEMLSFPGDPGSVPSVAISADGSTLATTSWKVLKILDAHGGKERLASGGHGDLIDSVAISADGRRIVTGGLDALVKVWDVATGQEALSLGGHPGPVSGVAINSEGRRIVSASWDGTMRVWDARTGQEQLTLPGHGTAITCVAISADGRRIIAGRGNGTINVWDVP